MVKESEYFGYERRYAVRIEIFCLLSIDNVHSDPVNSGTRGRIKIDDIYSRFNVNPRQCIGSEYSSKNLSRISIALENFHNVMSIHT